MVYFLFGKCLVSMPVHMVRPTVPYYEVIVSSLTNFILFHWLPRWFQFFLISTSFLDILKFTYWERIPHTPNTDLVPVLRKSLVVLHYKRVPHLTNVWFIFTPPPSSLSDGKCLTLFVFVCL